MEMNDYQTEARKTAIYPASQHGPLYPALGLCSEAGEVAGKIKKIMRDKGGLHTEDDRMDIARELGDVLWYVANIAAEYGMELDGIAMLNVEKLRSRAARGTLRGSGDGR